MKHYLTIKGTETQIAEAIRVFGVNEDDVEASVKHTDDSEELTLHMAGDLGQIESVVGSVEWAYICDCEMCGSGYSPSSCLVE